MPQHRWREQGSLVGGLFVSVHDVNVFEPRSCGHCGRRVLVQLAKVLDQGPLGFDVEIVLAAKEDHSSGGDESGQIVLLRVREPGQADPVNLRANLGVVVEDVCCRLEQVLELRVTIESPIVV